MMLAQVFLQCGSFENLEVLYVIYTYSEGLWIGIIGWVSAWRSGRHPSNFCFFTLLFYCTSVAKFFIC